MNKQEIQEEIRRLKSELADCGRSKPQFLIDDDDEYQDQLVLGWHKDELRDQIAELEKQLADNPCYDNQRIYCNKESLPLFASQKCSHQYPWMKGRSEYGKEQTLTEMLVEKYGTLDKALVVSASELITGCPGCGRTWCD
jgi:hypothetical protein